MFSENDKVTVTRGKAKGEATIIAAAENGQYAVRGADGGLHIVKADSIKAPQESTIGEAKLAAEIQTLIADTDGQADTQLQGFVNRLQDVMPGLGARIAWPVQSADEIQR
jgi:hypothetical protein